MEPVSIYALSSSIISGSIPQTNAIINWISNKINKYKLKKRVSGLLLLKGCTTLCNKYTTTSHLFLDLDVLFEKYNTPSDASEVGKQIHPIDSYLTYPLLRNHVLRISELFKGKIILVSHSLELLRAMPIYCQNIKFYAFSKEMEKNIGVIFPNAETHQKAEVDKFRIMRQLNNNQIIIVDNLQDLEKKVKENYDIIEIPL